MNENNFNFESIPPKNLVMCDLRTALGYWDKKSEENILRTIDDLRQKMTRFKGVISPNFRYLSFFLGRTFFSEIVFSKILTSISAQNYHMFYCMLDRVAGVHKGFGEKIVLGVFRCC